MADEKRTPLADPASLNGPPAYATNASASGSVTPQQQQLAMPQQPLQEYQYQQHLHHEQQMQHPTQQHPQHTMPQAIHQQELAHQQHLEQQKLAQQVPYGAQPAVPLQVYSQQQQQQYAPYPGQPQIGTPGTPQAYPVGTTTQVAYTTNQPLVNLQTGPTVIVCPYCKVLVTTVTKPETGLVTWLSSAGCCLFGCFLGCCFIPFCSDSLRDVAHSCPRCSRPLGIAKRI